MYRKFKARPVRKKVGGAPPEKVRSRDGRYLDNETNRRRWYRFVEEITQGRQPRPHHPEQPVYASGNPSGREYAGTRRDYQR